MNWLRTSALALTTGMLAACAAPPQNSTESVVQPTAEEQPADLADCDCAKTYRIALLLPLSGQYQDLGAAAFNGATMAFYEQHSPREVELRPYDTKGTVEGTRAAARQALKDGVDIFVGPVFTENVRTVAALAAPEDVAVMALSNDKSVAGGNVTVLGGHLEEEVDSLVQIVLRRNRRNVLLFAPDDAYGTRLRDEFQNLLAPHYTIAFNAPLFPRHASADELTKLVSRASDFESRYARLQDVLKAFRKHWEETQDSSLALSQTVEAFGLTERWEQVHPPACRYEDELDPELDGVASVPPAPVEDPAASSDTADGQNLPIAVDIPEEPPRMAAYEHTQLCERPEPDPTLMDPALVNPALVDPTADPDAAPTNPDAPADDVASLLAQEPLQDGQPQEEPAQEEVAQEDPAAPDAVPSETVATDDTAEAPEITITIAPGGALYDAPPAPDPVEEAAFEAELRHEAAVEDARFGLLQDFASCITYLSGKDYEEQKGVETIEKRFAKREVLGPPKTDTIILPLTSDRLRMVSSLFDYYHAGREDALILGTGLWDKAGDLSDELSLRGAKWVSDMRPHSAGGAVRYTTYFNEEPGYFSALSFDAVKLALNETRMEEKGVAPPGAIPFVTGESGVLRVLDDGTNERRVSVKEVTETGEIVSNSLTAFLGGLPDRPLARPRDGRPDQLAQDQYLQRMCVGR